MDRVINQNRFEVQLVKGGELLKAAQSLRSRVFFAGLKKDEDKFDRYCDHIVVLDTVNKGVIGTYRLLLGSVAEKIGGFYSQTEFDLKNIKKNCSGQLLEMGRACVDPAYRSALIINMMWKTIISYIDEKGVKYIIGCASVNDPTPEKIGRFFEFFKKNCFSPQRLRAKPLRKKIYPYTKNIDFSDTEVIRMLPSLIKGYLKMGAFVCSEPVWDKEFNTADFFMMLDTEKMNVFFKRRFL